MRIRHILVMFVIVGLFIPLFFTACDDYQSITFDNQTAFSVKPDLSVVPADFSGDLGSTYTDPGVIIEKGQKKRLIEPIPKTRKAGILSKYVVVAVNEKEEVIFSIMFTWDELYDMGWKIIIK
jgi:hypothetical protein